MVVQRLARAACFIALLLTFSVQAQDVTLIAEVDRSRVRVNESFTYTLRVEGSVRGNPTLADLAGDFDVLNRSSSTSVSITGGRAQQVAQWEYQLMPRSAGSFVIEPAQMAGATSNAVSIEVLEPLAGGDVLDDIFMEVEATPGEAYVQSQIVFTLRLYVGIGTGRASLTAPDVEGVEAIVERLGEDANYSTVREGRNYVVRERRYAVFAQEAGDMTIGPVVFEVMVIPNRGFSRVQRYRSDSVAVTVLPAVAPPTEYPQAVWLPARRVELSQRWSDDDEPLEMGIPRTRTLSIEADGLLETQLPDLTVPQSDGLRQYADQPELDRVVGTAGLTARRTERFAVIAQREGNIELAPIELPWWNVNEARWEVARIEPESIDVLPSSEAVAPAAPSQQSDSGPVERVVETAPSLGWLSALLAAGWALTAFGWWYTARQSRATQRPARQSLRQVRHALAQACASSDADAARDALLALSGVQPGMQAVHSLGALADAVPPRAAQAIRDLEAFLYADNRGAKWDGAALAAVLSELSGASQRAQRTKDPLPSLYNQ